MDAFPRSPKRAPLRGPRKPVGIRVFGPDEGGPVRLDYRIQFGFVPARNIKDGIHGCGVHGPHAGLDVDGRSNVPATSC